MTMLDEFRHINPKYVIMNASVFIRNSHIANKATIEIYEEDPEWTLVAINPAAERNAKVLIGYPTKIGLELMLRYAGFEYRYYDWFDRQVDGWTNLEDYFKGEDAPCAWRGPGEI